LTDPVERTDTAGSGSAGLLWRLLAYSLAGLHIAYVLFVLGGALLVLVWPQLVWLHLAAVAWAGGTMLFDLGCPITVWEKSSLRKGGREPYEEGFLQHHVLRIRFDAARTRRNHIVLGLAAIGLNLLIYSV